jgi:hypothetical protein
VTSCSLIQGINLFYPENGTSRLVWKIGAHLPNHTASRHGSQ